MKFFLRILFLLMFIALSALLSCSSSDNPSPGSSSASADESIEHKLASIDAKFQVPKNHITIGRFRSLLRQLSNTFVESKQEISDMTVIGQNLLRKEGIKESLLNIMEGMNQLFSTPSQNQKYSEYISAYVVLRAEGQTHSDAILDLKAVLQTFGVQ